MKTIDTFFHRPAHEFGPRLLLLVLLGFAFFEARDLWFAWNHSPFDALGWLAFAIWVSPLFLNARKDVHQTKYVIVGIALILLGTIGELNAFIYFGLAAVLGGLQSWRQGRVLWLLGSLSWMPLFGYFLSQFLSCGVNLVRVALATASVLVLFRKNQETFAETLTQ